MIGWQYTVRSEHIVRRGDGSIDIGRLNSDKAAQHLRSYLAATGAVALAFAATHATWPLLAPTLLGWADDVL